MLCFNGLRSHYDFGMKFAYYIAVSNHTDKENVMGNLNIDESFKIVSWFSTDSNGYYVEIQYVDGTHASAWVDAEDWKRIKEAELRYNIGEIGGVETVMGDIETARRRTFIAECRESGFVHLCAWCRSYVMQGYDGDEHVLIALNDGEFEATRRTGESHGICQQCKDGQVAAQRDMKIEVEAEIASVTEVKIKAAIMAEATVKIDELRETVKKIERERNVAQEIAHDMVMESEAKVVKVETELGIVIDQRDSALRELSDANAVISKLYEEKEEDEDEDEDES